MSLVLRALEGGAFDDLVTRFYDAPYDAPAEREALAEFAERALEMTGERVYSLASWWKGEYGPTLIENLPEEGKALWLAWMRRNAWRLS